MALGAQTRPNGREVPVPAGSWQFRGAQMSADRVEPTMLQIWTLIENLKDESPEAWLFPSRVKRGSAVMPLCAENWLKRVLKPAAKSLGFGITLHSLRRGSGTDAHNYGLNMKGTQGEMRHGSMSTTSIFASARFRKAFAGLLKPWMS